LAPRDTLDPAVINETERLPSRHLRDYGLQRFRGPLGCVLLHEPDQRVQHHHVQDPECQHQVRHITRQGQEIDQERQPCGHHPRDREHVGQLGGQFRGHAPPPRAGQSVPACRGSPPSRLLPG